jgi:hypothetical protein
MAGACSGRIDLHQRLTVVAIDAEERAAFLRAWRQFLSGQPSSLTGEVTRGGRVEVLSVDAHHAMELDLDGMEAAIALARSERHDAAQLVERCARRRDAAAEVVMELQSHGTRSLALAALGAIELVQPVLSSSSTSPAMSPTDTAGTVVVDARDDGPCAERWADAVNALTNAQRALVDATGEFERTRLAEQHLLDRSDALQRELGARHATDPIMALAPLVIDHGSSQSLHRDDGAALSLLSRAATLRPVVVLTDRPAVVQWAADLDPSVGHLVEWTRP